MQKDARSWPTHRGRNQVAITQFLQNYDGPRFPVCFSLVQRVKLTVLVPALCVFMTTFCQEDSHIVCHPYSYTLNLIVPPLI